MYRFCIRKVYKYSQLFCKYFSVIPELVLRWKRRGRNEPESVASNRFAMPPHRDRAENRRDLEACPNPGRPSDRR